MEGLKQVLIQGCDRIMQSICYHGMKHAIVFLIASGIA